MRILVHGLVGDNLGGIETFLLNMNEFMSDEFIFDYVVEEEKCMHLDRIKKKGGRVYKVRSRVRHLFGNTIDIIQLYRRHKDEYTTIYYNLSSLSWILPELIGQFMGFRIVVHSHNAMLIDANSGFLHRNMNRINKWILSRMDVTRLACSKYASEFMFGRNNSTMIYNGIDVIKYSFSEKMRYKIRKKYGISNETFVIGTVGRLAYQKNPLFTVEIFYEIQKIKPDSVLLMFGEGDLRWEIEAKVKKLGITDKVIMPGIVYNINDVLNAMDVFLLPSRHEGLGIALIEAQANGLPCFTSKDIVPVEAKVTELLHFVDLNEKCTVWAKEIVKLLADAQYNREDYNMNVANSSYNIRECALTLMEVLTQGKECI